MTHPGDTRALVFERHMKHPPDKIWRALTQSWLIEEWLMQNDFVAEVGRRFTVRAKPLPGWTGVTNCEVLVVEPPHRLAYRWGDGTESTTGLTTVVTWTLTPRSGGTLVRLEQSGFRPEDGVSHRRLGTHWSRALDRLETLAGSPWATRIIEETQACPGRASRSSTTAATATPESRPRR